MRRSQPALYLKHSPLVYVLAQVRFSAIVKMEQYIPDIQEVLRHRGFPKFQQGQVTEIRLEPNREPRTTTINRWEFQNKESTLGIILSTGFLVVHTSRYDHYEEFEKTISLALQVLGDVAGPTLVERIGLRYVDLVQPRAEETFGDYLQSGLFGLEAGRFRAAKPLHRYEFIGNSESGCIVVRWSQNNSGAFLPPDLASSSLQHQVEVEKGTVIGILDLDHFTVETRDFNVASIIEILQALHDNLDLAFRSAVTTKALHVWGDVSNQ